MKQPLKAFVFTLIGIFALSACSNSKLNGSEVNATQTDSRGIIKGKPVTAQNPMLRSTVQIFALIPQPSEDGKKIEVGVAGCTGSVIDEDLILTAAHCTVRDPRHILLYFSPKTPTRDEFDALLNEKIPNPLIRRVAGGMVPSKWPRLSNELAVDWGDIAVLRFTGGLPAGYTPAKLLAPRLRMDVQEATILAGFGWIDGIKKINTDRLLEVTVSILNPRYSRTEMVIDSGIEQGGPCHGDSGGPAYVNVNGQNFIAGVTSRAEHTTDPKGLCIGDTIYTKVQPYLTWLAKSVEILRAPDYQMTEIPQPQGE